MSFNSLLCDTATIQRRGAVTQGELGEAKRKWTDLHTLVPCRVETLSSNEQAMKSREGLNVTDRIFSTTDYVGVTERDRVITGGYTYEIISVLQPKGFGAVHHVEWTVNRVS